MSFLLSSRAERTNWGYATFRGKIQEYNFCNSNRSESVALTIRHLPFTRAPPSKLLAGRTGDDDDDSVVVSSFLSFFIFPAHSKREFQPLDFTTETPLHTVASFINPSGDDGKNRCDETSVEGGRRVWSGMVLVLVVKVEEKREKINSSIARHPILINTPTESTTNLDIDFPRFLFLPKLSPPPPMTVTRLSVCRTRALEPTTTLASQRCRRWIIKVASRECKLNFFPSFPNWHAAVVVQSLSSPATCTSTVQLLLLLLLSEDAETFHGDCNTGPSPWW